jgi:anti-anti-sigma regulatory factor
MHKWHAGCHLSLASGHYDGDAETMLKITRVQENGVEVLLRLEGKITDQWASLLDGECRSFLRHKKAVYLDCSRIDFIDDRGVEVLKNLPHKQVTLMSTPGFLTEMLRR